MKIGRTPREARLALVVGGGDWAKFKRVEANGCKCNILCEMALWIQRGMSWSMLEIAFLSFQNLYRKIDPRLSQKACDEGVVVDLGSLDVGKPCHHFHGKGLPPLDWWEACGPSKKHGGDKDLDFVDGLIIEKPA